MTKWPAILIQIFKISVIGNKINSLLQKTCLSSTKPVVVLSNLILQCFCFNSKWNVHRNLYFNSRNRFFKYNRCHGNIKINYTIWLPTRNVGKTQTILSDLEFFTSTVPCVLGAAGSVRTFSVSQEDCFPKPVLAAPLARNSVFS